MIITIKSIKDISRMSKKGKKYRVTEVVGTRVDNNEEWRTDIFKNKEDILNQLDDFGVGEVANFKFDTSGRFPELEAIEEVDDDYLEKVKNSAARPAPSPKVGGPNKSTSTGWNGRTGDAYNRSAAIYLAFDIMKSTNTEAALRKLDARDLLNETVVLANSIFDYIHHGSGPNPFEEPADEQDGDDLDPPEVD